MEFYERFRWAEDLFGHRDFRAAARVLEDLLGDLAAEPVRVDQGLRSARELLARAYFHAAQLGRAETAARSLLDDDPTNEYAALLLARTLRRCSRHDEADRATRVASALGAPGTTPATVRVDEEKGSTE